MEAGQAITVMWRGKPIFIRHRTDKEIAEAKDTPLDDLPDPLARNANLPENATADDDDRAAKDREPWLVMIGICTHLGCIPKGQAVGDYKGEYRRLVLPVPRLAIRYGGTHPQRTRAAEPRDPALCVHVRHQDQDRVGRTMAHPSTYEPNTGIERWLDTRLPVPRLMHDQFWSSRRRAI